MKPLFRFLPLAILPAALALALLAAGALLLPALPPLVRQGYQSFVGVMMLLMQL
jgi:hypothetical protein